MTILLCISRDTVPQAKSRSLVPRTLPAWTRRETRLSNSRWDSSGFSPVQSRMSASAPRTPAHTCVCLFTMCHGLLAHWTFIAINTGYLLVIILPTNCVSLPGKHFTPLSLSTSLNSFHTTFRPDPCILPICIFFTRPPSITSNCSSRAFSVSALCTFYLELSTCTHSFYQHPIHL